MDLAFVENIAPACFTWRGRRPRDKFFASSQICICTCFSWCFSMLVARSGYYVWDDVASVHYNSETRYGVVAESTLIRWNVVFNLQTKLEKKKKKRWELMRHAPRLSEVDTVNLLIGSLFHLLLLLLTFCLFRISLFFCIRTYSTRSCHRPLVEKAAGNIMLVTWHVNRACNFVFFCS